jgi:zinc transport system permease protein
MSELYESIRLFVQELSYSGTLPYSMSYEFVINAVVCALIIGPVLGAVGTMVVIKRMAFFSQAIGNAALTGVAIGVLLGESYTSPYASMFSFCILFALVLNFTKGRTQMSSDTLIGVYLSISLAVGASLLLFVSAKVNTHVMESILFGSILTVSDLDMNVLLAAAIGISVFSYVFYNRMLLASLNPQLAHVRGVNVTTVEYLFVLMLTILTVACVKIVGAVLVEALLLIPAAAARNLNNSIRGFVIWSMIFSTLSCLLGIMIPMEYNLPVPSGGAIVLVAACFFFVTLCIRMTLGRFREAPV